MNARRLPMLLLGLLSGMAGAQALPDPTRPPALVEGESTATTAPGGLQSIIRREHGKSAAVINGKYVELNGRVGDATLTRINEDSVELRSASGRETMYLTPGIGKKKVKP